VQSDGRDLAGRGTYDGGFTGSSAERAWNAGFAHGRPGKDADADSQSLAAAAAWVGAPGHSGVVPRQLPHALAGFVGREAEMTTLTGLLDRSGGSPGTVVISAIGGTAGVGVHP
jgi:hypothetical protein